MKILLLGEYSGVFNNLKKSLTNDGHEVTLISDGDGYKKFDSDLYIKYKYIVSQKDIFRRVLNIYYLFLAFSGLKGIIQIIKYRKVIRTMKGYDVVQLINPIFLTEYGSIINFIIFVYIKKNNKKLYLCALGDDYYWVRMCLSKKINYSMFDRMNLYNLKKFSGSLIYVYGFFYPFLNKYIAKSVDGIIPGLYDYYLAYKNFPNCTDIVPIIMMIDDKKFFKRKVNYPIKIFHGWQKDKNLRKGNDIFDHAIKKLIKQYPDKIEYNIVSGLPYTEYIKMFDECDLFIDQCFSQDKGVNGLLGMSQGKVVFSGFEESVKDYFNIDYCPLVNAMPNENFIFDKIEQIIINKESILKYQVSARKYISNFHNEKYVLDKYYNIWKKI